MCQINPNTTQATFALGTGLQPRSRLYSNCPFFFTLRLKALQSSLFTLEY